MSKQTNIGTQIRKRHYFKKPEMFWDRNGVFNTLWKALTPTEREVWNKRFAGSSYSGYVGCFWIFLTMSEILTMVYLKDHSIISVKTFKEVVSPVYWNFNLGL